MGLFMNIGFVRGSIDNVISYSSPVLKNVSVVFSEYVHPISTGMNIGFKSSLWNRFVVATGFNGFFQYMAVSSAFNQAMWAAKSRGVNPSWTSYSTYFLPLVPLSFTLLADKHKVCKWAKEALCPVATVVSAIAIVFFGQPLVGGGILFMLAMNEVTKRKILPERVNVILGNGVGLIATINALVVGDLIIKGFALCRVADFVKSQFFTKELQVKPLTKDQFIAIVKGAEAPIVDVNREMVYLKNPNPTSVAAKVNSYFQEVLQKCFDAACKESHEKTSVVLGGLLQKAYNILVFPIMYKEFGIFPKISGAQMKVDSIALDLFFIPLKKLFELSHGEIFTKKRSEFDRRLRVMFDIPILLNEIPKSQVLDWWKDWVLRQPNLTNNEKMEQLLNIDQGHLFGENFEYRDTDGTIKFFRNIMAAMLVDMGILLYE